MELKSPMLVVKEIDRSVEFYSKVLGLQVILDFGANKTLTGGLALQTLDSWQTFIDTDHVCFGGNDAEIYFEEEEFDKFAEQLERYGAELVHPVKEHSWGQRVVRFYDPDRHIIEVGEALDAVVRRFIEDGMTPEETSVRMDVPLEYVSACLLEKGERE